jgi:hypothetical protein
MKFVNRSAKKGFECVKSVNKVEIHYSKKLRNENSFTPQVVEILVCKKE